MFRHYVLPFTSTYLQRARMPVPRDREKANRGVLFRRNSGACAGKHRFPKPGMLGEQERRIAVQLRLLRESRQQSTPE